MAFKKDRGPHDLYAWNLARKCIKDPAGLPALKFSRLVAHEVMMMLWINDFAVHFDPELEEAWITYPPHTRLCIVERIDTSEYGNPPHISSMFMALAWRVMHARDDPADGPERIRYVDRFKTFIGTSGPDGGLE